MPGFLRGFNYISILKWGTGNFFLYCLILGAVLSVSLRDVEFYCTPGQLNGDGTCPITTGEDVLRLYNMDVDTTAYILGMVACLIIYRLIAYALIKLKLTHWRLKKV
jgi:hypothetical protein